MAEFFCYLCGGSFEKVGEVLENVRRCLAMGGNNSSSGVFVVAAAESNGIV